VSFLVRFKRGTDVVHTDFQNYVGGLCGVEREPGTIAYFDLDRTLIAGYSVMALAWERMRSGSVPFRRVLSSAGALLGYGLGRADYHHLLTITVRDLAGESERTLAALGERAFEQRVQGWIYAEARALIDAHRREGHHIVIVTSATRFQAAPIARGLGVEDLCCTEVEIIEGQITGKALPCFGVGKLAAAEHLAHQRQTDLSRAFFYSDSSDDLPLLEAVGRPVVVNPKMAMARLARSRGWPCLVFAPPGDLRSAAA
jgi:putative phosphoserine phosphatase/1-acylglycerol-3-phosphate O-acyltransferase